MLSDYHSLPWERRASPQSSKWMSKIGKQESLEPCLGSGQCPFWLEEFLIISIIDYFENHPILLGFTLFWVSPYYHYMNLQEALENQVKQMTQEVVGMLISFHKNDY